MAKLYLWVIFLFPFDIAFIYVQFLKNARNSFHFSSSSVSKVIWWNKRDCVTVLNTQDNRDEDDNNIVKTITLIIQDKKCTWLCEIRLRFVPSCSHVRRQLLYFQVVCKTWSIFQELTSIFLFKTQWKQLKFSENRKKSVTQTKMCSEKHNCVKRFLLLTDVDVLTCLSSLSL